MKTGPPQKGGLCFLLDDKTQRINSFIGDVPSENNDRDELHTK